MKRCTDCKYYSWRPFDLDKCYAKLDPVKGSPGFAGLNREFNHNCGQGARWFEPKRSIFEIIFKK